MTVIFDGDDNQRFILAGPFDAEMPYYYVMIKDYNFWTEHQAELELWMDRNLSRGREHQTGMVLTIEQEKEAMLFMMRWA
jgi:hypothetical protein